MSGSRTTEISCTPRELEIIDSAHLYTAVQKRGRGKEIRSPSMPWGMAKSYSEQLLEEFPIRGVSVYANGHVGGLDVSALYAVAIVKGGKIIWKFAEGVTK